ncbi:hypothetical protein CAOG_02949 [Capsaspora owczarzaki ATCC 30864]|uniref:NOD3 protein n=1 Tax=Capsaspora owczarzaki (strain ATCC 30864) TaxID=595528 RepID=A0A0D2WM76_CAPO3|nr:hypothetical protein CAOG_02949 [Capsaspora owczarzaki ATCC 30864]KJE91885.1 hypothetical protein CAOG_002949 [Capsaspora owczarzaki ATCC 30864]|eukprot:XP_004363788.1 hypothetical protein CAOG_02949 [Capsaspora owczarzaki ATCC 30864]
MLSYESMNQSQRELYDRVKNATRWLELCDMIDDEEAKAIAEALKVNTTLTAVCLDENQLDGAGAQAIAEALKVNTTLKDLYLWANWIGDAGAQAIAEALKVNTNLRWLDLIDNQIGDAGAQAIALALKANTTLTEYTLDKNQIGDAGAQAIAEALKGNMTVQKLYLRGNQIGDIGAQEIAEALKMNTTLTELDLRSNCIGNAGLQAIREASQVNRTLTRLKIDDQINPLAFSLLSRLATAEDLQTVFHLLTCEPVLEAQATSLPALPTELAELIMNEAHYWQGVHHTKRSRFYDDTPKRILKVTLPQGLNGNSIRVKAIQVLRDMRNRSGSIDDTGFNLVVRDEQGAIRYECSAAPTFVDSHLGLVTILPANHPVIRQMRAGWQVQVRPNMSFIDVLLERLYVGYI